MDDSWDWVEEICYRKYEPEMELPEDLYFYFISRYPIITEMIEKLDLDIEL